MTHFCAGMFVLVAAALAVNQEVSERVHAWFGPALDWIQRWMPLFYSPFLVALPRNAASLIGKRFKNLDCTYFSLRVNLAHTNIVILHWP